MLVGFRTFEFLSHTFALDALATLALRNPTCYNIDLKPFRYYSLCSFMWSFQYTQSFSLMKLLGAVLSHCYNWLCPYADLDILFCVVFGGCHHPTSCCRWWFNKYLLPFLLLDNFFLLVQSLFNTLWPVIFSCYELHANTKWLQKCHIWLASHCSWTWWSWRNATWIQQPPRDFFKIIPHITYIRWACVYDFLHGQQACEVMHGFSNYCRFVKNHI